MSPTLMQPPEVGASLNRRARLFIVALILVATAGAGVIAIAWNLYVTTTQIETSNRSDAILLARLATTDDYTRVFERAALNRNYALLLLEAPDGTVLFEHRHETRSPVPAWFENHFPFSPTPGRVVMNHEGEPFAELSVAIADNSLLTTSWRGAVSTLLWAALMAGAGMILTGPLLRRNLAPLKAALESLTSQLDRRNSEYAAQRDQLDHSAGHDTLTGLPNRARFLAQLDSMQQLAAERPAQRGALAVLRVSDLDGLNRNLGRATTDRLLTDIAARLRGVALSHPERSAARLNGSDFAIIAPDLAQPAALADEISHALAALENLHDKSVLRQLPVGVVGYDGTEPRSQLLARLDGALAATEHTGRGQAQSYNPGFALPPRTDLASWREALEHALNQGQLRLDAFPVLDGRGRLLHFETPSRVLIDEQWYRAEAFLPWVERLGLTPRLDLAVLKLALERIESTQLPHGINVSASSLRDAGFLDAFRDIIQTRTEAAKRLWIELPEQGVVRDLNAFRRLCVTLRPFGCRLGIEHAGREFGQLGGLHDIGLDYVKIDSGLVRNISVHLEQRYFAQRIVELAHAIGLQVIAEGVDHPDEARILHALGFDGLTGSAIRQPPSDIPA